MNFKKCGVLVTLVSCASAVLAQAPAENALLRAFTKFGGTEISNILGKGGRLNEEIMSKYFVVPSQVITDFMMPSVVLASPEVQTIRPTVLNRLRNALNSSPVAVTAPQYPVLRVRTTPPLENLLGNPIRFGMGDFFEFDRQAGISYTNYFSALLKYLYFREKFDADYTITNWTEFQYHPFTYQKPLTFTSAKKAIENSLSSVNPGYSRDIISINVLKEINGGIFGSTENVLLDTLIPDLSTGKFISYSQSIEPVWEHITNTFPQKTQVEFYQATAEGTILLNDIGFSAKLKDVLVLSNGNKAGIVINIGQNSKLIHNAMKEKFRFYLQPVGTAVAVPEDVSKIIKIKNVYESYVVYIASNEGSLYKIENIAEKDRFEGEVNLASALAESAKTILQGKMLRSCGLFDTDGKMWVPLSKEQFQQHAGNLTELDRDYQQYRKLLEDARNMLTVDKAALESQTHSTEEVVLSNYIDIPTRLAKIHHARTRINQFITDKQLQLNTLSDIVKELEALQNFYTNAL